MTTETTFTPRVVRWHNGERWHLALVASESGKNMQLLVSEDDSVRVRRVPLEEVRYMRDLLDRTGLFPYPVKRAVKILRRRALSAGSRALLQALAS